MRSPLVYLVSIAFLSPGPDQGSLFEECWNDHVQDGLVKFKGWFQLEQTFLEDHALSSSPSNYRVLHEGPCSSGWMRCFIDCENGGGSEGRPVGAWGLLTDVGPYCSVFVLGNSGRGALLRNWWYEASIAITFKWLKTTCIAFYTVACKIVFAELCVSMATSQKKK